MASKGAGEAEKSSETKSLERVLEALLEIKKELTYNSEVGRQSRNSALNAEYNTRRILDEVTSADPAE